MIRIEDNISATLKECVTSPSFLEVSHGRGIIETTPEELSRKIDGIASQLYSWGIREKYLVPLFLWNSLDFIVVFLSLLHIKAIPLMVKMEYRELELAEIFNNAKPQAIIAETEHLGFLGKYLEETIVITRTVKGFSLAQSFEGIESRKDVPDEVASINYTYRGYGYPLGAMISHGQYLHGVRVLRDGLYAEAGEKMLLVLPMTHIFTIVACIFMPLLYKMTSVIVDTLYPRHLFRYIANLRVDYITAVPEIYALLSRLKDPNEDLSSLKTLVSGGSLLTKDSYENIRNGLGIELCQGYGLTEFTPVSANRRYAARSGTVGPVCDQVACRIESASHEEEGEILIKTPDMMGAYYRRPQESEEANQEGWFRTGDLGRFEDGHLVFIKELKKTRKINGNLVDLEEVSRAICMDKDIAKAQVSLDGNSLVAGISISKHIDLESKTKELRSYLRQNLAAYKIPKKITAA